jgi:hypothetical protein
VGALMTITGLCYLTHSFANVLSPPLAVHLFTYLMPLGFPGELLLTLWLLAIGVNVQRWKDQAGVAGEWRSQRAMNA